MDITPTFSNFDLHIGQGKDGVYPVSVHYCPAGETTDPVQIPIACDDEPMRRWLQRFPTDCSTSILANGLSRWEKSSSIL